MQYNCQIEINHARDRVTALFDDPIHLPKWQEGLQSFELISGIQGAVGSKSRIRFKMGKREIEMIETLEVYNLPEEFTATYEADKVFNRNVNRFIEEGNRTIWRMECEFQCTGVLRILAALFPGMFRRQTQKMMRAFKAFAESQPA